MPRLRRAAFAVVALAFAVMAPARAFVVFGAVGQGCQAVATTDVTREAGYQSGVVTGELVRPGPGTLTCAVYVQGFPQASTSAHTVGTNPEHVARVATTLTYQATASSVVVLCSTFRYDSGSTEWWDATGGGFWRPAPVDPSRCATYYPDPNSAVCPVLFTVDQRLGTNLPEIWQDCESYRPIV